MRHLHIRSFGWSIAAALTALATMGSNAHAQVVPASTFDIAVVGFNSTNSGSFLTASVDAVFGTTQTFTGVAKGGQTLTVTSSETIGATNVTDTVTISVPTNFAPTGTTVGSPAGPVTSMEADFGGYNAGTDTLDFAFPEPSLATSGVTGQMLFSGGMTFALSPQGNVQLSNGNMSLEDAEGVGAGGSDLAAFAINSFSFTFTYPVTAVPEPTSLALVGLFTGAGCIWRRRSK